MSSYVTTASEAGDWFLERLAAYQEMWLNSVSTLNKYFFAAAPMAKPDFSESIEVTKANFGFWEKLLLQQKKFAEALYQGAQPSKPSPTKKKTKRTAAKSSKAKPKTAATA